MTHKQDEAKAESQQDVENGEMNTSDDKTPSKIFDLERDANILFRCLACNDILKHKDEHRLLHDTHRRKMVCHLCGAVLGTVTSHRKHLQVHEAKTGNPQFDCKFCDKKCFTSSSLRSHTKSHSVERNHICDSCGKGFKYPFHLHRHKKIHLPMKPMTCKYCGKGFNNDSNLRGHLRIHTGEKPYKCDLCAMAYTHNVSLKSHKKSVHGIDLWKIQSQKSASSSKEASAFVKMEDLETIALHALPKEQDELAIENSVAVENMNKEMNPSGFHRAAGPSLDGSHQQSAVGGVGTSIPGIIPNPDHQRPLSSHQSQLTIPSSDPSHAGFMEHIMSMSRGTSFGMTDAGMSSQNASIWDATRRTFTKL